MKRLSGTPIPFFSASEIRRRQLRQLDAPLILASHTLYRDTDFVLSERFAPSDVGAALYAPKGARRVTLRNCTVRTQARTWEPAWTADPSLQILSGVRLDSPQDLAIDGLHVEGFPAAGLTAHAMQTAKLTRISVTRCLMGATFPWVGAANHNVRIDRWRTWDTWGPGPGILPGFDGSPSAGFPGQFTGGDGIAGYFDDSTLRYLEFTGELFVGLKLVRSKRVRLQQVLTPTLMIQGTQRRDANVDGSADGSEEISIRSLLLDKRFGGSDGSSGTNGIQVSWHVAGLDVRDFALYASGRNGHAIQLSGNVSAAFRGGVVSGWNGTRGGSPAFALELSDEASVNADFESANRFYDQNNVVRRGS